MGLKGGSRRLVEAALAGQAPGKGRVPTPRERDVQTACADWLRSRGAFVIRVNSGALRATYQGRKRLIRFNSEPGCSDLLVCWPGGRLLAVEVKRPGGKPPTLAQKSFLAEVNQRGGLGVVVRSAKELEAVIKAEGVMT